MFAVFSVMCCREGGVDLWFFGVVELVAMVASVESWGESIVLNYLHRLVFLRARSVWSIALQCGKHPCE